MVVFYFITDVQLHVCTAKEINKVSYLLRRR